MAFLSGWKNPVKLPPDEQIVLQKRESLRTRGIAWLINVAWLVALASAGITLLVLRSVSEETVTGLINTAFIVLAISLLPATLALFIKWRIGTYELSNDEIRTTRLASIFHSSESSSLDLRQITRVEVDQSDLPARLFNLGSITLSTGSGKRLTMRRVQRPQLWAAEIKRRILNAHAFARTGQIAVPAERPEYQEIHRSGSWLLLMYTPAMYLILGTVVAWLTFHLRGSLEKSMLVIILFILSGFVLFILIPRWAISFLRWWLKVYVVTDRRVMKREGILHVKSSILPLEEIVSATAVESSILGRILDVGNVEFITAGVSGNILMEYVSAPDLVRQQVLEIRKQALRQREQLEIAEIRQRLKVALRL